MFLLQDDAMSSVTGSSRSSLYNNNNNNHGEDNIHSYSFAADDNLDDDDMIAIQEEEEEIAFRPSQPPALSQQQQYSPSQRQKPPPKVVRRRRRDNNNNNNIANADASMTMMQASSQEFHTAASAAAATATKTATDVLNESSAFSFLQQLLDEPDQQQQQHDQNLSLSMSSHEDDDKAVPEIQQQTKSTHDTNTGDAMRDEQPLSTAKTPKTNDDDVVIHNPRQSSTTNNSQTPGNHRLDNHNQNIAPSASNLCQQDDHVYQSNQNYKHSTGSTIHRQDLPHCTRNHDNSDGAYNDNDDSEKDQPSTSFWMNQEEDDNDEPSYMDTIRQNCQNEGHETTMARALQRQRHIQRQQTRSHSPKQQQKSTPSSRRHRKDETSSVQPSRSLRQRLEKQRLIGGSTSTSNRNKMKKSTRSVSADRMTRDERPSKVKRARSTSPNKQSSSRSKPQPVQKAKTSIVGHRPSHWGRNTSRAPSQRDPLSRLDKSAASRSKSRSSIRNSEDYQSQRQRKQLAAACATSHLLMPPPPARRRRQNNTHTALATPHSPIPNLLNISSISFKPDFLPQGHRNNPMDASGVADSPMEIDTYDDSASVVAESANTTPTSNNNTSATPNNNNNTNNAASFLATVRANNVSRKTGGRKRLSHPGEDEPNSTNNRSSSTSGPLSRLLKQIKSELRIDGTRLRSGEYPFPSNTATGNSSRRFDMCDPRNRATSYMDVTLVGDTLVPWNTPPPMRGRQSTPRNFTLLGYIHTHHHYADRDPRTSTTAGDVDKSPVTISPDNLSNSFAWICLSSDTVQEHNLFNKSTPQGYQLRIYNAITTAIVAAEEEEKSVSNVNNNKCRFSVLCTQLCEPYPTNILGALQPELEQLVTSLPM